MASQQWAELHHLDRQVQLHQQQVSPLVQHYHFR